MKKYYALLIDTVSIQKYIFGSNYLKENIGASHLVSSIYSEDFIANLSVQPLKSNNSNYLGYIGGGNALFFFENEKDAQSFVKEWSTRLLIASPGLTAAVAFREVEFEDENDPAFQGQLRELYKDLNQNKSENSSNTIIQKHGITADCERSGYTKEARIKLKDNWGYFSSTIAAKHAASKDALKQISEKYKDLLKDKFVFSNDLENLGKSHGDDSHLAIVHIDGNSMGEKFKSCRTLNELQILSSKVKDATEQSFQKLLEHIIEQWAHIEKEIDIVVEKVSGKKILPIRPIILGGDDITFVCDGRMGIYFARIYMEEFENNNDLNGEKLSSCAGVAITKLKYPFYRGYQLAEQLCENAKVKRREEESKDSWLDFHISSGNISGTLNDLRKKYISPTKKSLLKRPYKIGDNISESGFDLFIKNARILYNEENGKQLFPFSKIKELREVLTLGESKAKKFVQELNARGHDLPAVDDTFLS